MLTDGEHVLFCNNEDWENFKTRIWFVPEGPSRSGCVYVGFDNGWAQGGMNTAGLAFDWVAGYRERWQRDSKMKSVAGNPCELMLATCRTADEAVAFFREHWEPSFSYAKVLVADRTGASVRIGAHDGALQIERDNRCRGFGYAQRVLDKMLVEKPTPTPENAETILRAARQDGRYATKYSNVYDLKSGDIFLLPTPGRDEVVKVNLNEELKKGGHFYDMPEIHDEMAQAPRPLPRLKPWWRFW